MKEEIIDRLKKLEEKFQTGEEMVNEDVVFLFGLSLLKDNRSGN